MTSIVLFNFIFHTLLALLLHLPYGVAVQLLRMIFCSFVQMSMNVPVVLTTAVPMQCAPTVMVATYVGARWDMMEMDTPVLVSVTIEFLTFHYLFSTSYPAPSVSPLLNILFSFDHATSYISSLTLSSFPTIFFFLVYKTCTYLYLADIDECANGTASCDTNAQCTDTDGSYECSCNAGFEGNGYQCYSMHRAF